MLKLFSSSPEIEPTTSDSHPTVKPHISDGYNVPLKLTKIYLYNVFDK